LPDGTFVTVSFTLGCYAVQSAYEEEDKSPKESYFNVDPTSSSTVESD